MGRCYLCRPELALRNSRVTKGCFDPRLHDRRHGPYVGLKSLTRHTFADLRDSHVDCSCIPSSLYASRRRTWHGKWHRGTRCCRCLHPIVSLFVIDTRTCIPLFTLIKASRNSTMTNCDDFGCAPDVAKFKLHWFDNITF
jgi:hypothetical protein